MTILSTNLPNTLLVLCVLLGQAERREEGTDMKFTEIGICVDYLSTTPILNRSH